MAEGRVIRKDIVKSQKLFKICLKNKGLEPLVLYMFLLIHVDINGVYECDIDLIRSHMLFRYLDDFKFKKEDVEKYLNDFADKEFELVIKYELAGKNYLWLPDFIEKQLFSIRSTVKPDYPVTPELQLLIDTQWHNKTKKRDYKQQTIFQFTEDALKVYTAWNRKHMEMVNSPLVLTEFEKKDLNILVDEITAERVRGMLRYFYKNIQQENWNAKYFFKNRQDILDCSKEVK